MNLSHSLHSSCLEVFGHKEERRGEGAPSPPACLPLACHFFLAPKYLQAPATQAISHTLHKTLIFTYFTALIISQLASPVFAPF